MKSKKIFSIFLIILILIGSNKLLGITLKPKEKDGLWGYVDENNFWRINPQYHFAAEFHNGCARVMNYYNHNGYLIPLYNYVKSNGDKLFEKGLDYASDFQNGYAVIGSRWGEFKPSGNANYTLPDYRMHLVDSMGVEYNSMYANVLLPPDSLGIVGFSHNDFFNDHHVGYIYRPRVGIVHISKIIEAGNVGIPMSLMAKEETPQRILLGNDTIMANNYSNGINQTFKALLCHPKRSVDIHSKCIIYDAYSQGHMSLITSMGDTLSLSGSPKEPFFTFQKLEDKFIVQDRGFIGLCDSTGSEVLPTSFGIIENPYINLYICKYYNGKWCIFSNDGEQLGIEHDGLKYLGRGLFLTRDFSGKYEWDWYEGSSPVIKHGVVDVEGNQVLPFEFETKQREYAIHLIGNMLWARKDGLWGAYNLRGESVVPHSYNYILQSTFKPMSDNLVQATDSVGRATIYDKNGRDIAGPIFSQTSNAGWYTNFSCQLIKSFDSGLFGVMTLSGDIIIEPAYDEIKFFEDIPLILIHTDKKWGMADIKGKIIVSPMFDQIDLTLLSEDKCLVKAFINDELNEMTIDL